MSKVPMRSQRPNSMHRTYRGLYQVLILWLSVQRFQGNPECANKWVSDSCAHFWAFFLLLVGPVQLQCDSFYLVIFYFVIFFTYVLNYVYLLCIQCSASMYAYSAGQEKAPGLITDGWEPPCSCWNNLSRFLSMKLRLL